MTSNAPNNRARSKLLIRDGVSIVKIFWAWKARSVLGRPNMQRRGYSFLTAENQSTRELPVCWLAAVGASRVSNQAR